MTRALICCCCCCVALSAPLLSQTQTVAADQQQSAVIDVNQVDDDFHYQGEFVGNALDCSGWWRPVGLQVIALGNGAFEAAYYSGGLPGNGWTGALPARLHGERDGEMVQLAGEALFVTVRRQGVAQVAASPGGPSAGELQRMVRFSRTAGASPPPNAIVLFDGHSTEHWKNGKTGPEGTLQVGAETQQPWRDFTLHAEFRLPYAPRSRGQGRGNSGFYLQRRYEVQVLDSFGLEPKENEAAALYKYKSPDLNMSFPPLSWQTYDIHFTAARFNSAGEKVCDARITVWHNGIVVHNNAALTRKTGAGKEESPDPLPILLQDHGNPVQFRNIWIIPHGPLGTS